MSSTESEEITVNHVIETLLMDPSLISEVIEQNKDPESIGFILSELLVGKHFALFDEFVNVLVSNTDLDFTVLTISTGISTHVIYDLLKNKKYTTVETIKFFGGEIMEKNIFLLSALYGKPIFDLFYIKIDPSKFTEDDIESLIELANQMNKIREPHIILLLKQLPLTPLALLNLKRNNIISLIDYNNLIKLVKK